MEVIYKFQEMTEILQNWFHKMKLLIVLELEVNLISKYVNII